MTRFARAKGSKSSNEKVPSDGTPWSVMKEQLDQSKHQKEDSKKRQEAETQRQQNYQKFLADQKVQKRKATWCDFPEQEIKKVRNDKKPSEVKKLENNNEKQVQKNKKSKKIKKVKIDSKNSTDVITKVDNIEIDNTEYTPEVKKNKQKNKKNKTLVNVSIETSDSQPEAKAPQLAHVNQQYNTNNNMNKQKKNKLGNDKWARRKPETDRSFQLIINGKEIELIKYDGFPIMKKDAERLQELKENMIKKGIPKSEVQRTMKLERRRAEKALARLKRDVCYNCRKGGHNLSDCPDLKTKIPGVDAADGLCFKCGSTEHKSFDCKVHKDQGFRFATCFICKEQGHIARQCPDNPKGLYPNGGGCKVCGDVTHLRKDCPSSSNRSEETKSIRLETLDTTDTLEGFSGESQVKPSEQKSKKPKKIKF